MWSTLLLALNAQDERPSAGTTIAIALVVFVYVLFNRRRARSRTWRLTDHHRTILAKYAIHYQRSGPAGKQRMEQVVATFVNDKRWVGAGIEVADEMKVMISACAAQLLMGFDDVVLSHFETIVVYPDTYRSPKSGRMHQGEVRPKPGIIIISWEDFVHGYAHSRDAHNVGLHEMAHALWFENSIENGEDHFLQADLLQRWGQLATADVRHIKSGGDHFFRDYAGTNQAEFFAVAVEYFFEQPLAFQEAIPEHYRLLCGLLRQDPLAESEART